MIKFTELHIKKICENNKYKINESELVFFGIRNASPENINDTEFHQTQAIKNTPVDYLKLSCTIGQWDLKNKKIALFLGSTVPHQSNVASAKLKNGQGANQLMKGLYLFNKGVHNPRPATAHQAFVQASIQKIQRTSDDLDYDKDDRITYENPWDNIHAAWTLKEGFASAGCQVIAGFPKCEKNLVESGPWKIFRENAYSIKQTKFQYILFDYDDLKKVVG